MMSPEPEYDAQAAGTDIDFLQQPGRYWADFSGPERTLLQRLRIPANLSGIQRTQYHMAVNRKVAGSSPAYRSSIPEPYSQYDLWSWRYDHRAVPAVTVTEWSRLVTAGHRAQPTAGI
jgi:hypothetical protein